MAMTPRSTASAIDLPPEDAIAYLRQKTNTPTARWGEVWDEAHTRAFAVAGATSQALLTDFRAAVAKALEQGTTLKEFRRDFDSIVAKHGWVHNGSAAWRSEIIYETNLSMAYSAGRYAQMTHPDVLEVYPYWQYQHTSSARPRPQHLAWVGTTLRADDPWWSTHYPPNGWRCRCGVRPVSGAGLRRQGKSGPDKAPPIVTHPYTIKATGRVVQVPDGIDPGFGYNPGAAWRGEPPPTAPGASGAPLPPTLPPTPAPPAAEPKPQRMPRLARLPRDPEGPLVPAAPEAADAVLKEASRPWAESLTQDEAEALQDYKTALGRPINAMLREGGDDPGLRAVADRLAAAIERSQAPATVRVFRGLDAAGAAPLAGLAAGDVFTADRAFTSTSVSHAVAATLAGAGGQVVQILIKRGTRGVAYIHPFPRYRFRQYEMLLKPGIRFRVRSVVDGALVMEAIDDDASADDGDR